MTTLFSTRKPLRRASGRKQGSGRNLALAVFVLLLAIVAAAVPDGSGSAVAATVEAVLLLVAGLTIVWANR